MAQQSTYDVAPQMADYDQIGQRQQWVPYLMLFCQPDCAFPSVTTDGLGFRTTLDRQGRRAGDASNRSCSIVVGGSTVFGVGATHDRHTIPSILNRITDDSWLNFGGRAFNSTQEIILFLLHLPQRLDRILLLSGVNNVILALANKGASPVYGAFIHSGTYEATMKNPRREYMGVRWATAQLLKELRRYFLANHASGDASKTHGVDDYYQNILSCCQRDLRAFKTLAKGLGIPIYFALQPLATWIDKALSPEEQKSFAALDALQGPEWQTVTNGLRAVRDRYFVDMADICANEGVPFFNLNLDPAFREREWLFVDRVHLTDRGHALAADIVKREFIL